MSTVRYLTKIKKIRGICTWCKGLVKPPKRTWCSKLCVHEYLIRSSTSYIRRCIKKRDKGICAKCNLVVIRWEVDHIVPVSEGGGCCGMDNLRTLCVGCHKIETAKLAARRAQHNK